MDLSHSSLGISEPCSSHNLDGRYCKTNYYAMSALRDSRISLIANTPQDELKPSNICKCQENNETREQENNEKRTNCCCFQVPHSFSSDYHKFQIFINIFLKE